MGVEGTNKKSKNIIIPVVVALVVIIGIASVMNMKLSKAKVKLAEDAEIVVKIDDAEAGKITPEDLNAMEWETFTATQKSSGKGPVDKEFTGVPIADVLANKEFDIDGKEEVLMGSLDGYTVALTPEEVMDKDNVWLVWECDGEQLDSSSGPYMVIIRKDPFSQRWSKQLCEITVK